MTSRLLIDEPPIAITPSLIRVLGGHDLACFAQQVHYIAAGPTGHEDRGHRWAVRSSAEWCEIIVVTPKHLKRLVSTLTELGVLVRYQPRGTYDRTAWSRIDEAVIDKIRATASVPLGTNVNGTAGDRSSAPRGTDVPMRGGEQCLDLLPAVPDGKGPEPLTPNQLAQRIMTDYWTFVEQQSGRKPSEITAPQFKSLIVPFLRDGVKAGVVAKAVGDMYRAGTPLTRQGIGRTIDGRSSKPAARRDVIDQLNDIKIDQHGNLVE